MATAHPNIQLSPHALRLLSFRNLTLLKKATALYLDVSNSQVDYGAGAVSVRPLLVRDLYEALQRDYEINNRRSIAELRHRWRLRLGPAFGELPVAELRISHLNAYIDGRLQAKAANGTINRDLAELRRCYTLAIKTGIMKFGERPYFPMLKENPPRKGSVSDAQYQKLAHSTREIGVWLRALFEVGFIYGWRKGELLSRRVHHADLLERTLSLDAGETKNDQARTAQLTPGVFELIKGCCSGKSPDDYLFTRPHDHRGRRARSNRIVDFRDDWARACCAAGVGRMICKACRKAGEKVTVSENPCPNCGKKCDLSASGKDLEFIGLIFHDLRRSGASNMIRDGLSERQAMSVTGHLTRSTFDRYHIVDPAQVREIANKMERGATLRGIPADPLQIPLQLSLPFGDAPRKPADRERLTICRATGCREKLHPLNKSGYCRTHTILASRKVMSAKLLRCEFQGKGCVGEFHPTRPGQLRCKVCRIPAKNARARKPAGSESASQRIAHRSA
jgi:integrase